MILLIDGPIDVETVNTVVKAYNDVEEKGGGNLHIYFQSGGGEVPAGEAIIDIINAHSQNTTVTAFGILASMGFLIFARILCPKRILPTTYAIAHLTRWSNETLEGGRKVDDYGKFKDTVMKKKLNWSIKFYEALGFNEEEIEELKEGGDIHISYERLEKMFKTKTKK